MSRKNTFSACYARYRRGGSWVGVEGRENRYPVWQREDLRRSAACFDSTFQSGSDVYALTRGPVSLGSQIKLRKPNGDVVSQVASKSTMFVAHFGSDGRHLVAVSLDVPFYPQRLGVFDDSDFLIAGINMSRTEPRLALVAPNGQLRRLIELVGVVHLEGDSATAGKEKDPTAHGPSSSCKPTASAMFLSRRRFNLQDRQRRSEPSSLPPDEQPDIFRVSLGRGASSSIESYSRLPPVRDRANRRFVDCGVHPRNSQQP